VNKTPPRRPVHVRALLTKLMIDGLVSLIACLIFLTPASTYGQSASDIAATRRSCVQGLAQQALNQIHAAGIQMGLAEMCVRALSWTANNDKLLDIYVRGTGRDEALALVNRLTDSAKSSTGPFRPEGSPGEMWRRGDLTPSLAFDAAFTRSYLNRPTTSSASTNPAELKRITEGCLRQTQSLADCAEAGRIQAALAYQMNNAFSNNGSAREPKSENQGPERAPTQVAIDQKFQKWARSWSFDRYRPGSAQITDMNCTDQCKVSGRFSFVRMGSLHTIPFVAFLPSLGDGSWTLGRLCYNDETTNMLDCTP